MLSFRKIKVYVSQSNRFGLTVVKMSAHDENFDA